MNCLDLEASPGSVGREPPPKRGGIDVLVDERAGADHGSVTDFKIAEIGRKCAEPATVLHHYSSVSSHSSASVRIPHRVGSGEENDARPQVASITNFDRAVTVYGQACANPRFSADFEIALS